MELHEAKKVLKENGYEITIKENINEPELEKNTIEDVKKELYKFGYGPAAAKALINDYRNYVINGLKNNSSITVAKMLCIEDVINELIDLGYSDKDAKNIVNNRYIEFIKKSLDNDFDAFRIAKLISEINHFSDGV